MANRNQLNMISEVMLASLTRARVTDKSAGLHERRTRAPSWRALRWRAPLNGRRHSRVACIQYHPSRKCNTLRTRTKST